MATKPIPFGQGLQPFFKLPDHIKPPPGFPFIVLPAETPADTKKPERSRLADNVVCMFQHDCEPITNIRWRGRYPRKVTRWRPWDRLHAGDYCMVWLTKDKINHGCIVQLVERDKRRYDTWHVRAINQPIYTHWADDPDNPEGHKESWECQVTSAMLRRCAPPSGHRRGAP